MFIEVCDLCKQKVNESNKTKVIIKDHKGLMWDGFGYMCGAKRKYKAVICDDCLSVLRGEKKLEPPTGGSAIVTPHPPKRK